MVRYADDAVFIFTNMEKAKEFKAQHGGTIQLESEPERSAFFIVELPLQAHGSKIRFAVAR
jgi:hypothetical protein